MDTKNNQPRQQEPTTPTENTGYVKDAQPQSDKDQDPSNRLKDGTNDFQNGDQEHSSESSS